MAQQAFGSPDLMQALNRLDAHLQAARPGEDWGGSEQFSGDNPFGMGEGTQALADIAELEQLAEQLSQSYPGATMDDVDLDALARQLGDQAAVDARTLAELERALVNQGFWTAGPTANGGYRRRPCAAWVRRHYAMWHNSFPAAAVNVTTGARGRPANSPAPPGPGSSVTPSRGTSPAP